jgi:putative transcriptional regulator
MRFDAVAGPAPPASIPLDVAAIRRETGLSQAAFALRFGISVKTLRNWEQRYREPHGPAKVLLIVIRHRPDEVMAAIEEALGRP